MYYFFSFFFLIPSILLSSVVDNLRAPSLLESGILIPDTFFLNIRVNAVTDQVFEKKMRSIQIEHSKLEESFYGGTFLCNFKERLDLYFTLFGGKWKVNFKEEGISFQKCSSGLTWQAGTKVVLIEIGNFSINLDVNYKKKGSHFYKGNNFVAKEWQISPGIGYQQNIFSGYLGMLFDDLTVQFRKVTSSLQNFKLRQKHFIGALLGFSLSSNQIFYATLEGRFISENALSAIFSLRF